MFKEIHEYNPYPSLGDISWDFPPVDWLWPSWIPRGMLTLLAAAPGVGKSLVALDLARRIIHDRPFPDGAPVPCPGGNVLIVDAENTPALINQRASAWEVDSHRLFLMRAPAILSLSKGGILSLSKGIDLADPEQQLHLIRMVGRIKPALLVVDSLAVATSSVETSLPAVSSLLSFLATIAQRANIAILIVHHLRKRSSSGGRSRLRRVLADDLRGSSHITAAACSVLSLSPCPEPVAGPGRPSPLPLPPTRLPKGYPEPRPEPCPEPVEGPVAGPVAGPAQGPTAQRRLLEVIKTNLCSPPPPLGLLLQGESLSVPTLSYSPFDETWLHPPSPPTKVELCARWLLTYLARAGAPVKPAEIKRAAAQANYSRNTLYRARLTLADSILELGAGPRDPHKRWILAEEPPSSPPTL